jgi:hypothetical protein
MKGDFIANTCEAPKAEEIDTTEEVPTDPNAPIDAPTTLNDAEWF